MQLVFRGANKSAQINERVEIFRSISVRERKVKRLLIIIMQ